MGKRMERNSDIEKAFIKSIAQKVHDIAFIQSALNMMNTDEKRKKIIDYINKNPEVSRQDIDIKMFYISIGKGV